MQEKLLSAGGFPYFSQGNPGRLMHACLWSAYTVKSSVFWTPRALLRFPKCYLAHRVQSSAGHPKSQCILAAQHTGSGSASVRSWARTAASSEPSGGLKSWTTAPSSLFNAGMKFLARKKGAVGAAGVLAARDARGHTAQTSTGCKIKAQLRLSSEDAERCLWIALS